MIGLLVYQIICSRAGSLLLPAADFVLVRPNPMTLHFTFNDIEPIWIPGTLPLAKAESRKVKVRLAGWSSSRFPPILDVGELLCGARPWPPEYFITLLLTYPYSTAALNPPPLKENIWSDVPGATIYTQIRIPLPAEAIPLIREADGGEEYSYELTLENVELENKTKTPKA
jgi:hypothetical protein